MQLRFISATHIRSLVIAGIIAIASFYCFDSASAQSSSVVTTPSNDTREAHVYRLLFHQSLTYKRLADEADAAGTPKPHFRRILANRLQMSDADAASLLRLSLAYQAEIDPIQEKIAALKVVFFTNLPQGVKPPWKDARSPDELRELVSQEDAIALRYRDLLQNELRPDDFQKMVARIHATFGLTLR